MGRKKKIHSSNNLGLAFRFLFLVFFLIVLSFSFKLVSLIQQSHFDGEHRFTISLSNAWNPRFVEVVSLSPETRSLSHLVISGHPSAKAGSGQIGKFLAIPINGRIVNKNPQNSLDKQKSIESKFRTMLFRFGDLETDLTLIDIVRLWYAARAVPLSSITTLRIDRSSNEPKIDKISYSLFADYSLIKEKKSIQIINGTEVLGLGNRLARFITNMGGNVVEVVTSDSVIQNSQISYLGDDTYTTQRLSEILDFLKIKTKKQAVSDIVIMIGKNSLDSLIF